MEVASICIALAQRLALPSLFLVRCALHDVQRYLITTQLTQPVFPSQEVSVFFIEVEQMNNEGGIGKHIGRFSMLPRPCFCGPPEGFHSSRKAASSIRRDISKAPGVEHKREEGGIFEPTVFESEAVGFGDGSRDG